MPKTLFGFYWRMIKEYRWYSITLFTLKTISHTINIANYPFLIEKIYSIFDYRGPDFWSYAAGTILFAFCIQLARRLIMLAYDIFESKMRPYTRAKISAKLDEYIFGQDYKFFADKNVGFIQQQAGYIYDGFHTLTIELVANFAGILAGLGLIFGMLYGINPVVAGIILANGIVMVIWRILTMKKNARLSAESSKANSRVSGTISDNILNFANIKTFASDKYEVEYARKARMEAAAKQWIYNRFTDINNFLMFFVDVCIAWIGTILYCVYLFHGGLLNVTGFAMTIAAFGKFEQEFSNIGSAIKETNRAYANANQAWKELMVPRKIKDRRGAGPLRITRGTVELRNISFRYHSDWIVRGLSLKIRAGEKVGIVGVSGSGKTTLSHLLLRLFDVRHGGIFIDGQNIKDVLQDSLRSQIAFVPQDPVLFNRTLGENIAYARPDADASEIEHAAKLADIRDFIIGTEKGYGTLVGNRGIKLSGGQRQRVAIARAILKNSPILILDEATSALDSETERSIQKSFDALMKKRTVIAIAHRLSTIRKMDRIVVMESGRIAEQGTHGELLRRRGIYAKLWKMQSGGFV